MVDLVQMKLDGMSSEVEHHKIAKIVKLASTEAEVKRLEGGVTPIPVKIGALSPVEELAEAKAELLQLESELASEGITTKVSMLEGYNHSVGLIMGELWLSALPENLEDLGQKVSILRKAK